MPSTSKKQHNFMEAIAHSPAFAKKVGVKQSVGKDFAAADKGKKFKSGGLPERINKPKTHHTDGGVPNLNVKKYVGFKGGGMATSAGGKLSQMMNKQLPKGIAKQGIAPESKQMGMLGMKKGGSIKEARMEPATMEKVKTSPRPQGIAKLGSPKSKEMPDSGPTVKDMTGAMKKGGKVRGDGLAQRGKTKGRIC